MLARQAAQQPPRSIRNRSRHRRLLGRMSLENQIMKSLIGIGMILALCACGNPGQVRTSFSSNGFSSNGQSLHSMDLTDPHFYMDDDEHASGATGAPMVPHYTVDPFCASKCQSTGHAAESCNRICGF